MQKLLSDLEFAGGATLAGSFGGAGVTVTPGDDVDGLTIVEPTVYSSKLLHIRDTAGLTSYLAVDSTGMTVHGALAADQYNASDLYDVSGAQKWAHANIDVGTPANSVVQLQMPLDLPEQSAPPNPAAGKLRLYAGTDHQWHALTSGGTDTALGSGGGGGTAWQTLTDGSSISWDTSSGNGAQVTLAGNRTLSNPTNLTGGQSYLLAVKQDATGGRRLTYGSAFYWPGGLPPTLSSAANAEDLLLFGSDGTRLLYRGITLHLLNSPVLPDAISNLAWWIKADAITGVSNGATFASWPDSSSAGITTAQSDSTKQPLYLTNQINGQPAAQFDGTNDGLTTTLTVSSAYTIFLVYAPATTSGSHRAIQGASNNYVLGNSGASHWLYDGSSITGGSVTANTPYLLTAVYTGSLTTLSVNGTAVGNNTSNGTPGAVVLGAVGAFTEPANALIAEIVVYSRALSSSEITTVQGYLANKYALF